MGFRIKAVLGTGNVSISGAGYAVGTSAQGSTSIHLGLSLISKAWSSSELVSPSAVSVLCLADFVYSIPCKFYLVLGPPMYLTTDYAKRV